MVKKKRTFFKTFTGIFSLILLGWILSVFVRFERSEWALKEVQNRDSIANVQAAPRASDFPDGGPNIFVKLAKTLVPSVVNISTTSRVKTPYGRGGGGGGSGDPFNEFWEKFFGMPGGPNWEGQAPQGPQAPPRGGMPKAMSLGTGFIIDPAGLILTNNHVVQGADEIKIHFTEETDEQATDGQVVGRDPELDLALIKVKTKRTLVPVVFGDSDALEVGEYVMAVGNPFGQGHSVTHGIISAKNRNAPDFVFAKYLQTDAPINPGNSGGPLVNLRGEVIGINNAIDARAQGIGFAIPSNQVRAVLSQLKTKGVVSRGYIGVNATDLAPEIAQQLGLKADQRGAFVSNVFEGQPADKAGLKPYDVVIEFDGQKVTSSADLVRSVTAVGVGQSAVVKVLREGKEKSLTLTVAERSGALAQSLPKEREIQKKDKKKPTGADLAGITVANLTPQLAKEFGYPPETKGVVIEDLSFEGPAAQAGLSRGDLIVEIERKPVKTVEELDLLLNAKKTYLLRVKRPDPRGEGEERFMVIVLDLKNAQ